MILVFNRDNFISRVKEKIIIEIQQGNFDDNVLSNICNAECRDACTYSKDCYEILMELNPNGEFATIISEFDCRNVTDLAYYELLGLCYDEFNYEQIIHEYNEATIIEEQKNDYNGRENII